MAKGPLTLHCLPPSASLGDAEQDATSELLCAQRCINPKGNPALVWVNFMALKEFRAQGHWGWNGAAPQKGHQILRASVSLPAKGASSPLLFLQISTLEATED